MLLVHRHSIWPQVDPDGGKNPRARCKQALQHTHTHAHSATLYIRMHVHARMHMLTVAAAQIAKAGKIERVMHSSGNLGEFINSRAICCAACPPHTYHMKLSTRRRASKHRKQTKKGGASIDDTTGAVQVLYARSLRLLDVCIMITTMWDSMCWSSNRLAAAAKRTGNKTRRCCMPSQSRR